jgi:ABC-2 type transport system ATP-binding protein
MTATLSTSSASAVLQCQGLSLGYDRRRVLNNITLSVPAGAVVGLVGRNGAGKSTLMRCLLGLTLPEAGQAQVLGCTAADLSDTTRERLGYVSQTGDLLPWLTVWQHVQYIGSFYPRWQALRAHALCQRLQLSESAKVAGLSVGEQQKLAIVLALAHDPDVLLLDEPVASLDPLARRDFMRLLFEADAERSTPRTVLLSSHLLSDLERVVSHVVFLRDGQVQLQGAWDELLEQLRRVDLPAGAALPAGVLAQRTLPDGRLSVLVDGRGSSGLPSAGQALALEELFVELNA